MAATHLQNEQVIYSNIYAAVAVGGACACSAVAPHHMAMAPAAGGSRDRP